jgi:hypothetical protein
MLTFPNPANLITVGKTTCSFLIPKTWIIPDIFLSKSLSTSAIQEKDPFPKTLLILPPENSDLYCFNISNKEKCVGQIENLGETKVVKNNFGKK